MLSQVCRLYRINEQLPSQPRLLSQILRKKLLYIGDNPLTIHTQTTLRALSSETTSQLHILGHDCDTLAVDRTKIGILMLVQLIKVMFTFKQRDEVSFNSFLEGADSRRLESEICLEILGYFPDKTLEREFADQKLSRFLVSTDFTERNGTGAVTMGLLNTSGSMN
jgi:hypothetical protein